ncbi:MAG: hypothetical protein LBR89_03540 [Holosporales bacterium]|nr:hypothetical protein [Holosporales bacterium]
MKNKVCCLFALIPNIASGNDAIDSTKYATHVVQPDTLLLRAPDALAPDAPPLVVPNPSLVYGIGTYPSLHFAARNHEGLSLGLGFNVGRQKTDTTGNHLFDTKSSNAFPTFGWTISLDFTKALLRNFFIGLKCGIDIGVSSKSLRIGGTPNVALLNDYHFRCQDVVRQAMQSISRNLAVSTPYSDLEHTPLVPAPVWHNFLYSLRYLGGAPNIANLVGPEDVPGPLVSTFMTAAADGAVLFDDYQNANPLANFVHFIGDNTLSNIAGLGGGNLLSGFKEIRRFITTFSPTLAQVFQHMAESRLVDSYGRYDHASNLGGADSLTALDAWFVSSFFANDAGWNDRLEALGITHNIDVDDLLTELNNLYVPNYAAAPTHTSTTTTTNTIDHDMSSCVSWGCCPHASISVGCFFAKNFCVSAGIGIIQLNGHILPVNNLFGLSEEKFKKAAPLLTLGLKYMISNRCSIGLEIEHACKVTKKFPDTSIYGFKIKNKVSVSKTDVKLTVSYKFG